VNGAGSRFASAAAALALLWLAPACSSDGGETQPPPDGGGPRPGPDGAPSGSGGGTHVDDAATTGGASGTGGKPGSGGSDADAPSNTGGAAGEQADSGTPSAESGTGAGALVCDGPGARFATSVVGHEFGPGQNFGQDAFPAPLFGAPKGAGERNGSTDVVSLGNGGTVTVAFEGNGIADEPGPDFIVFENAFWAGGDAEQPFAELGTVAVSDDGVTWHEFPCTATQAPYGHCSGWRPVYANPDENALDPLDPAVAGGDPYDLSDIGVDRARFVRITDRADLTGLNGVYDLDAVGIVHGACP
jgi:hypothetical protein